MIESPRHTGVTVFVVRPLAEGAIPSHWIGHAATSEDAAQLAMLHCGSWSEYRSFIVTDWNADTVIVDAHEKPPQLPLV